MLSGMLMLRHLGENDAADRLERAIAELIREGKSVTYDMKPSRDDPTAVGTSEVADALIEKLGARQRRLRDERARKVTVVGAGNVGATCAQVLATRDYADVVLVDIKEGLPQGKALDIDQMGAAARLRAERRSARTATRRPPAPSVVVITAGVPRGPGMSRDDLVATNEKIVADVTAKVVGRLARRDPDRRLEPARRDVPRGEERLRLADASACSAWPGSSTPRASRPSSPGRPARRSRT